MGYRTRKRKKSEQIKLIKILTFRFFKTTFFRYMTSSLLHKQKTAEEKDDIGHIKKRNQFDCTGVIVITTKTS